MRVFMESFFVAESNQRPRGRSKGKIKIALTKCLHRAPRLSLRLFR